MAYSLTEITDRKIWDQALENIAPNTFLQSWNWGEFNEKMGSKIWRCGLYFDGAICGLALTIKVNARRGSFLLCPHGPIFTAQCGDTHLKALITVLTHKLLKIARAQGCVAVRLSPLTARGEDAENMFAQLGFRRAPLHMHPELSWILDIEPAEDELLKGMRKTTRYSIRKAEKDGVEIIKSADPANLEKFWRVYRTTVDRQNFVPFSARYLRAEFEAFTDQGRALLFFGAYRGEIISAAFIIFTAGSAFYHHGASLHKYSNVPASQLIQWHAILEAKKRGCARYNFWGIAPEGAAAHPWAGLTLFKKGFGGYTEEYVPAQDFPLNARYWLLYAVERFRKFRRNL